MGRTRALLVAVVVYLAWLPTVQAGNNAGGTAYLTWDVAGQVPVLSQPVAQPFPLYLHLAGVPDIRSLAVSLRWAPYDSVGACYTMISGAPDESCGAGNDSLPGGPFAGDSSYTWSIRYAPGDGTKTCVQYWFSAASCDTAPPGKFAIASVAVLDGNGSVDTLRNVGDAKLSGVAGADTTWWGSATAPPTPSAVAFWMLLHPNPTTGEVRLDVSLPSPEMIHLGIYDLAGRAVRQLEQGGALGSGLHRYRWDLRDASGQRVPSGIYFARVASARGSRLMRIVVVK
ncbi:MAG TPA: FlgD immunoglobulin-like domain containing protein [Candidatus Eisenbacteria bacterium]|jgi:hypothetical protein